MELTVLGASGSFPTADDCCSGFLLRHEGFTLWMDAGSGTMQALQRHVAVQDVDAIVLSHRHMDHVADIHMFFHASMTFPMRPVPVVAPPDVSETLARVVAGSTQRFFTALDWQSLSPGEHTQLGPFRIDAFATKHSAPNNALRITDGNTTLCYSGDSGPADDLIEAARDADLFVCEATWLNDQAGVMPPIHSTCAEAGEMARKAGARRLAITHLWPGNDREKSRAQAADTFGADVMLAREVGTLTV